MTTVVAIIPARGGSVGLPGKNVKPLNGRPLVARTIAAARAASAVSRVIVSSDDQAILEAARHAGAEPLVRPQEISGSTASSEAALLHAIEALDLDASCEAIVFLQCTSPFTTGADIDRVVAPVLSGDADSAFSAVEDHGFIWTENADGRAKGITHDASRPRQRRQDMAPRYRENGAIYAMRLSSFRKAGSRFAGRVKIVPIDAPAIEVDTLADWRLAEAYAQTIEPAASLDGLAAIRAVVMDFDGVHTDDRVFVTTDGAELVACSRGDGMGIEMLRNAGFKLLILSKEENAVVRARAAKLRVDVLHGVAQKAPAFQDWCERNGLTFAEVAYVGNDVNDIDCMRAAGISFAPADAHRDARAAARHVLTKPGGRGALRELAELLLAARS